MTVFGIPWAEVREAGRLDRLFFEISIEHRRAEGSFSRADRAFGGLFPLFRWFAVATLIYIALAPEGAPGRGNLVLTVIAFLFCLPLWRMSSAAKFDSFQALRHPSREALLLARWRDMAPALIAGGLAWALFAWSRTRTGSGLDAVPHALLLLSIAAFPFRVAAVSAWKRTADKRERDVEAAFLRCTIFAAVFVICSVAAAREGGGFLVLAGILGLLGLLFLALMAFQVRSMVGDGPGGVREWARGAAVVLGKEFTSTIWVLLMVALALKPEVAVDSVLAGGSWWLAGVGLLVSPVIATFAAREALRGARTAEVVGLRPGQRRDDEPDEGERSDEQNRALQRWFLGWATRKRPAQAESIGPGRRPPRGAWAAHLRELRYDLGFFEVLMVFLYFFGVGGAAFLVTFPDRGGAALFAPFLVPWLLSVAHRDRAFLLGMDLREQVRHDLRAFAVSAVLPLLLAAGIALGVCGWTGERGWAMAFLVAGSLFRAGRKGLRSWLRIREPRDGRLLSTYARLLVAVFVLCLLAVAYGSDLQRLVVPTALLGLTGAAGLVLLLTRSEDDLRTEMRLEAESK